MESEKIKKSLNLKQTKLIESKGARFSYAKYVGRVAEVICSLLVLQGDTSSVVSFINESLPKIIDISEELLPQDEELPLEKEDE